MSLIKYNSILKYGLYLIILLPMAFTPFTFFPWHYGKTMIFQIVVEVLAVLWLIHRMSLRGAKRRSNPVAIRQIDGMATLPRIGGVARHDSWWAVFWRILGRLNLLDWSILLFLAIITLTAFTGVNPANSFWGNQARANGVFTWLHFGAFYFLLAWCFKNLGRSMFVIPAKAGIQKDCLEQNTGLLDPRFRGDDKGTVPRSLLNILTIAVLVAVLASLTSLFPQLLPSSWLATSGGGIIGNRAFLAAYLVLAVGISLYLFTIFKNKWRWLFLVVSVLFFYTIIDTGSRGALLGIVIGAFFGLTLCLFFVRYKKVKIWSAIFLIVLCSLFLTLFLSRQSLFWQKYFSPLSRLANISFSSGTVGTRLMAWQSGLDGFKEKPFFGWGWGNYEIIFNKYYNPQFLQSGFAETVWDKPHNWVLEIVDSAGIFGFLAYLSIFIAAFYYLFKTSRSWLGVILAVTLVAYFVQDLFLFETTNGLILWFVTLAFISSQSPPVVIGKTIGTKNIFSGTLKIILFIILFFSLYRFNFVPLHSSYFMRQAELAQNLNDWLFAAQKTLDTSAPFFSENAIFLAEQLVKFDKAGAVSKDANIESAALPIAKTLDNESKKYSDNLAFPVWAGQVYLVLGEKIDEKYYVEAERYLSRALEIAPRKQEVLFLLVRLYLLKHDATQAIRLAQEAVEVAPDIGTSHWFLGLANVASGNRAQGLKSIEKAMELGYNLTADQRLYVLDLYALEKNYPKLIEEYKKMIEANPENINWLIKLAAVYAESGDKKAALETTRQAIGLFPPLKTEADKFIKQYKLLEQ